MSQKAYVPPLDAFQQHASICERCKKDQYGFCALGYRLLGEAARMRADDRQLPLLPPELLEKAPVRIFFTRMPAHK